MYGRQNGMIVIALDETHSGSLRAMTEGYNFFRN